MTCCRRFSKIAVQISLVVTVAGRFAAELESNQIPLLTMRKMMKISVLIAITEAVVVEEVIMESAVVLDADSKKSRSSLTTAQIRNLAF